MFIRTERLLLHPTWPENLDELVALLGEESIVRNLDVRGLPRTPEALSDYIARPRDPLLPHFFIEVRSPSGMKLVGGIGLGREGEDIELGYWIGEAHRGNGYAEEAVRAVLDQARTLGHRRIVACHFADNTATGRILEKAGFANSGVMRDRFSPARGGNAPALVYVAELKSPASAIQPLAASEPATS